MTLPSVASSPTAQQLAQAFGRGLRSKRLSLELSQEGLEFGSGVHRTYISELERGLKSPSLSTLLKLALALETTPGKLLRYAERDLKFS